jgi:hypothetical protein
MIKARAGAVIVLQDGLTIAHRARIVDLAAQYRLPAMFEVRDWTTAGGFMAYGANDLDLYRRAALYVDKILKGAKPADLPVEQPTKFELVINLKTAKALDAPTRGSRSRATWTVPGARSAVGSARRPLAQTRREAACQVLSGIYLPRLCCELLDERLAVGWQEPPRIPASRHVGAQGGATLHDRHSVQATTREDDVGGDDRDAVAGGRKGEERRRRCAFNEGSRMAVRHLAGAVEQPPRHETRFEQQQVLIF